jgi:hypothetical protein
MIKSNSLMWMEKLCAYSGEHGLLNERKLHRLKSDWQLPDFANN